MFGLENDSDSKYGEDQLFLNLNSIKISFWHISELDNELTKETNDEVIEANIQPDSNHSGTCYIGEDPQLVALTVIFLKRVDGVSSFWSD